MKKIMAAILCIALALSVMSIGVFAEETVTSSAYTIDATAGTVSGVKPFTTVQAFEATFSGGDVQVVNVDGSLMDDTAYATENVYARIDGEFYRIVVKYNYDPIETTGRNKADGVMFERPGDQVSNASTTGTGFDRFQVYGKIGTGSNNTAPSNTADQTVKATKATENGEPVYVIENDTSNYAYLRSHYSSSNNYSTDLYTATRVDYYPGKLVTTVEFEADKLGNISLFNNTPARNNNQSTIKGDTLESLFYTAEYPYVATSVHFIEDGSVKLGGMYSNYTVAQRTPAHSTDFTWEPGKKYTVSVVQSYTYGGREAYVHGVYVNGTKIFPYAGAVGHADGRVALQSNGTYKIGTKDNSTRHGGGLSSIMIGTAPATAGDNFTVTLSEAKIYNIADYNPALDADITLASADPYITIDNDAATVTSSLGAVSADRFTMDGYSVAVNGNVLTVVSADGLTAKKYAVTHGTGMQAGFYNADTDAEITSLAGVTNVGFTAFIDKASTSQFAGKTARVYLAVYKNDELAGTCVATGDIYSGEMTNFIAEYDLTSINAVAGDEVVVRAFIWDRYSLVPLTESFNIQ